MLCGVKNCDDCPYPDCVLTEQEALKRNNDEGMGTPFVESLKIGKSNPEKFRRSDPEKVREYNRLYYARLKRCHPEKIREYRRRHREKLDLEKEEEARKCDAK